MKSCNGALQVSTHSRLKAAGATLFGLYPEKNVSTHSRLKAAGKTFWASSIITTVSTHSRLKAAGTQRKKQTLNTKRFNTQPPEGGWLGGALTGIKSFTFQHTAA